MKFPYLRMRGKLLPIVPVEINNLDFYGFLDSGASYSIFHSDVAEILGIEIEKGDKILITIGDGSLIPVHLQKLEVKFAGKNSKPRLGFQIA